MRLSKLAGAVALGFTILSGPADAAVVVDIFQSGGDVVATGSGAIDLTGLSRANTISPANSATWPRIGAILLGASGGGIDLYTGISGPASFGLGTGPRFSSSGAGDLFGLDGNGFLDVPQGYASGTPLSGSATFAGQTIASLGMAPGTYVYTWNSAPTAVEDSLTANIASGIPEPATWAMMMLGFAGLGHARHRAARKSAALAV